MRGWAVLLVLGLAGCPPEVDPCPTALAVDAGPPAVDLGTGLDRFVELLKRLDTKDSSR